MKSENKHKTVTAHDVSNLFATLPDRTNKGDMGRVLCICGAADEHGLSMCGAAYFAAMAAYRCGAGIVEIFTHSKNYAPLAARVPEAVFCLYDGGEDGDDVCERLAREIKKADAVIIGCGIGVGELSQKLVRATLGSADCPLLLDADALNILSRDDSVWDIMSAEQRARTVITPHPGEMSRLTGKSIESILSDTVSAARDLARERGVVCLLKDHRTVITDGAKTYINCSGNAGMATAGMGDVLAGVIGAIAARLSKGNAALSAAEVLGGAAVGAYVHGLAGDAAAQRVGQYSLVASDVLSAIPEVLTKR